MNLRIRLIVAFVAFSVLPLGAMTWYTYSRGAQVLRDAAEHESDLLAAELSQRMQLVTTQLSDRVDHLMDVEGEGAAPTGRATAVAASQQPEIATIEAQVADRLGEAAMLLNNVELRGLRPRPPAETGTPPAAGAARGNGRGVPGAAGRGTRAPSAGRRGRAPSAEPPAAATPLAATAAPAASPTPPGEVPAAGAAPVASLPAPTEAADQIRVDLANARRDLFREVAPGKSFQEMDATERQRVVGEINQRLLGIQQGLRLGAAALEKQAAEARDAAKDAASVDPAAAPIAPAAKSSALTGNHLNVRRERNGVVRQVNAEVNLTDLLSMVFTATPRDRGEVPFAIDTTGRLYTATPDDRARVESLGAGVSNPQARIGATRLPAWIVVTSAGPAGSGLRLGVARPVGAALSEMRRTAVRSAGLGLLFICVALLAVVPLSVGLTRNLSRLNVAAHRIAAGDYRARVTVHGKDEVGRLGLAFNQMAQDVEAHRDAAVGQERIRRELELGRRIQHDMLPREPLVEAGVEVRGVSRPAGEVGGDFFNYLRLQDGRVALLVGDVSGKGVGAALLMATIQAALRTRLLLGQDLTAIAQELDRDIEANTPGSVYATLFVALLDPETRLLRYVNAGHPPPLVVRRSGAVDRMQPSGLPIGMLAGLGYTEGQVQLEPGDLVFCYTDGCADLESEAGEMLGTEALEQAITAGSQESAGELIQRIDARLSAFRGHREPFDDMTMMVAGLTA